MFKESNLHKKNSRYWTIPLLAMGLSLSMTAPSWAQREDSAAPVDLTKLVKTAPDNAAADNVSSDDTSPSLQTVTIGASDNVTAGDADAAQTDTGAETNTTAGTNAGTAASPILTSSTSISVSSSLTQKDPSSIRLGSLGLDREDVDGLGRLMWEGSDARTVLELMASLDPEQTPRAFRAVLDHMMAARAVPPEGFIDIAPDIINAKLNWLASSGASDDLAAMIRQLPDTSSWEDPKAWLLMHDLMTRNDAAACATAQKKVLVTLDALWHQVNAFCAIINGDDMRASFALDILKDSGAGDPLYYELMQALTNGDVVTVDDQMDLSLLNIILMDSARININADALANLPTSYSGTATRLRYLDPAANRLLGARAFAKDGAQIASSWALLPRDDLSSAEALTRLRFGGEDDILAIARLNAWHAINAEKDDVSSATLAFEALIADYQHSGIASLDLWLPLIEGGINSPEIDAKIGPIMGFANDPSRVLLNDEAMAWHNILGKSSRPVSSDVLYTAGAYDAIPMIMAMGRPVADIDWGQVDQAAPVLTTGSSLPYAALKQIEMAAGQGQKAELILRLAQLLQGKSYTDLNRDDAAQLVGILNDAGMEATADALARDILITWAADRHIMMLVAPSQGS